MEAWILQGIIMFAPPVIGAMVVRTDPAQWQRWVGWIATCLWSWWVMQGAGWSPFWASWAILGVSFVGAFATEIFRGIAANINGRTLQAVGVLSLVLLGWWFLGHASRTQLETLGSIIGLGIVGIIVVRRFM